MATMKRTNKGISAADQTPANFAWVKNFIHHLAPGGAGTAGGMAGIVLANGSMSSNQSGDCPARSAMKTPKVKPQSLPRQRDIRRALIEADLVDTALRDSAFAKSEATPQVLSKAKNNMVALAGQLFYSTQIPVCLWFLTKNKNADAKRGFRDRRKQTLFIDARKLGTLIDRFHRELIDADFQKINSATVKFSLN